MKRCIALVVLACVLFVSTGIAEDSEKFVLRNGITWGMSPEEVAMAEGKELSEYLAVGDNMYYSIEAEICGAKSLVVYYFDNQKLFAYSYSVIDTSMEKSVIHDYIDASLKYKYGVPKYFSNSVFDYFVNKVVGIPCEITVLPICSYHVEDTYIISELYEAGFVFYVDIDHLYSTSGL